MGSINKVVAILVVWAVMVTVWMVVLSISGSWSHCPENRARAVSPVLYNPRRSPEPVLETRLRLPTEAVSPSEAATSSYSAVRREKLLSYFSRIMQRPSWELEGMSNGSSREENCTVVILTSKKKTTLSKIISHYCKIPFLQAILVLWNDANETIPFTIRSWEHRCAMSKVKFILPTNANKPINRYFPWKEIRTDCVCFLNDDLLISVYDMQFGYEVWQNFRYQIVGFQESSFSTNSNGSYVYNPHQRRRYVGIKYKAGQPTKSRIELRNGTRILHVGNKTFFLGKPLENHTRPRSAPADVIDGYSIMGVPSFLHKVYLEMYFDPEVVPASAVEYVEEVDNCEDILLSVVATKFLHDMNMMQPGVMVIKNSLSIKNLETEEQSKGRPEARSNSMNYCLECSECLNRFSRIFGQLPLQSSNTIATLI